MDKTLSEKRIKDNLKTTYIGRDFHFFEETSSTFDEAQRLPKKNGTVICARKQTSGRGRLGRRWESEMGGIYFSVILKPELDLNKIHIMTALCATGVQRAIAKLVPCYIKWPNDIVSKDGKKLCGILTKLQYDGENESYINVGIGINANTKQFDNELKYASSIGMITGNNIDESKLLCDCLMEIENSCRLNNAASVMNQYKKCCITLGRRVRVLYAHEERSDTGLCTDIALDGSLVIEKDDGSVINVNSGEVSVRGIYGEEYV